ncbi:MAG: hypothetical protein COZ46_05960 [Verrucomicrobia bacterium CG_4_10_14_3_um_filter_43_23]|nr:MAG: hypothetical protein AUJ82_02520 [Verrucomicrobia bacterium CG1_02_43_26]PIP59139.1 MAG: hypothetical protein COX01_04925 [Verrucomicrobia bacterium CG22_combo_CG10-13_8_21_14_all_43_17]PIX58050.1 MAG: hypothetical protein COZ46_05960 [Verrucomicrobia bacterium CG_4_10_14_3_um_filter_43_23]PIY62285.1 MAG: hypothetical protein COY94_02530 [Verrucomicrobia bacterium CG_4_10_14_0_8_um_filter_43_34]PJA43745.1 MAG: hypothetical protein CO175_06410 [Verrucomicrobia bacterium CG_4_9_14_3_um_fi
MSDEKHSHTRKIHITQITPQGMNSLSFSADEAQQFGFLNPTGYDLLAYYKSLKDNYACPTCDRTRVEIETLGKVGCADCYETFSEILNPFITTSHKDTIHCGKVPAINEKCQYFWKNKVVQLKSALGEAIKSERFEDAAEFRDLITQIESTL